MNITVVEQVSSALSFASLRNQVIASNIAHRDTPGYQRLKAQFDEALGSERSTGLPNVFGPVAQSQGRGVVAIDNGGSLPSIEEDMVALSTNTMNYQALARALSRYFSIAEIIANGGRT